MDLKTFATQYEREHAVTRKVLAAYPAEQASFKPHERSNTALTLAQTFVVEEKLMLLALRNEPVLGSVGFAASPKEWDAVLAAFDAQHAEMMELLGRVSEADLQPVQFFSGPGQMQDYPAPYFLWFMLLDQIHHRGQFSVYLRMSGGKVPSIYGPSADEPWT
ncbi:MAG TPA: DinB family protein [Thermoanaerobaculia bacterium]|nr:DinB family protein [Thermoanaerobaculia bacterium]